MFVRWIDSERIYSLYECDSVQIILKPDDENKPRFLRVHLTRGNTETILCVDKEDSELYIMNDRGKTIDSYRWNDEPPTAVKVSSVETVLETRDGTP